MDSDDPPSDSDQVIVVGSFGIADRVRNRKGTSAKALKPIPKSKFDIPTPSSRFIRQKNSHGKAIASAASEDPEDDGIHGKRISSYPSDF